MEPFGEARQDARIGILTATLGNVNRDPKKRGKPFEPADFIPSFRSKYRPTRRQTPEQMLNTVVMWNKAVGGKDLREK